MSALNKEIIQSLREQRGWSQSDLAEAVGIHRSVISRIERGLQEDIRLSIASAMADALGVSIEVLLGKDANSVAVPEFEAVIIELRNSSEDIQRQATGILRGYLSTMKR